jgi:hypothetical protein
MIKTIIFILTVLFGLNSHSQQEIQSKKDLKEIFTQHILQKKDNLKVTVAGAWIYDDADNLYSVKDTIKLTNFGEKQKPAHLCNIKSWTFITGERFLFATLNNCGGNLKSTTLSEKDIWRIEITKSKKKLILNLYRSSVLVDQFEYVSVERTTSSTTMVLHRIYKASS